MKNLKDFARETGISYVTAWRKYNQGLIEGAYKNESGNIVIGMPTQSQSTQLKISLPEFSPVSTDGDKYEAKASTKVRRNAATTIEPLDRYKNIRDSMVPYSYVGGGLDGCGSYVSMRDMALLCQKAYYSYGSVRHTVRMMVEFCASEIYLTGGNEASRKFFYALFEKINISSFIEEFFLEFWRSSNVFIFRYDSLLKDEDINELTKTFGLAKAAKKTQLPTRYIVLNPVDILLGNSASYVSPIYYKQLTAYEVQALKNGLTDSDKEIFDSFPPDIKKAIKEQKGSLPIIVPLPMDKIFPVFNGKMSYESFAVSLIYPLLDALEVHTEMSRADAALIRTTQQIVLLCTIGSELKDGTVNLNQKNIETLQTLLASETISQTIVSDWTTRMEFVVPDISSILDDKKYNEVNRQIKEGLGSILVGTSDEKFANKSLMLQVFVERLVRSRRAFLDNFLIPEIKRISKEMGFRNWPRPSFSELNLKDELEFSKLYVRLIELGVLAPEEGIVAMENGRLPTPEESLEAQEKYLKFREKGYYMPLAGGPYSTEKMAKLAGKQQADLTTMTQDHQMALQKSEQRHAEKNPPPKPPQPISINLGPKPKTSSPSGRPSGTKSPKTKQKVSPVGASLIEAEDEDNNIQLFSARKIKDIVILASQLESLVEQSLRERANVKRDDKLTDVQAGIVSDITTLILINEEKDKWLDKNVVEGYIKEPFDKNQERVNELQTIAFEHQLGQFEAAILLNSKIDNNVKLEDNE